jgi:hypothetical protein
MELWIFHIDGLRVIFGMAGQEALLSGFLQKQGDKGLVKGWKKRWFIISPEAPHLIRYQRKVLDTEVLGQINLALATAVKPVERNHGSEWPFYIDTPGRRYNLLASDEETMNQWITVVEKVSPFGFPRVTLRRFSPLLCLPMRSLFLKQRMEELPSLRRILPVFQRRFVRSSTPTRPVAASSLSIVSTSLLVFTLLLLSRF